MIDSDNRSYDLLVRIAGLDAINQEFLPRHGLEVGTIGSAFTDLSIRVSPSYTLREWTSPDHLDLPSYLVRHLRTGEMPRRTASRAYRSNNFDLFDLAEVVRRVMLHGELPADDRFELAPRDVIGLQTALCLAKPAHYQAGAAAEWGEDVEVCGKSGWWVRTAEPEEGAGEAEEPETLPPACTDVALITDPDTGRRILLAATGGCYGTGLPDLAGPALRATAALSGTPLQHDAGLPVGAVLGTDGDTLVVDIETEADGVQVWVDGGPPVSASRTASGFVARFPVPEEGPHVMVIEGLSFGVKVAYRAVDFDVAG